MATWQRKCNRGALCLWQCSGRLMNRIGRCTALRRKAGKGGVVASREHERGSRGRSVLWTTETRWLFGFTLQYKQRVTREPDATQERCGWVWRLLLGLRKRTSLKGFSEYLDRRTGRGIPIDDPMTRRRAPDSVERLTRTRRQS